MPATPNHALQKTAPRVTVAASATAFPPTSQLPRRTPLSLSLWSFGGVKRLVKTNGLTHILLSDTF